MKTELTDILFLYSNINRRPEAEICARSAAEEGFCVRTLYTPDSDSGDLPEIVLQTENSRLPETVRQSENTRLPETVLLPADRLLCICDSGAAVRALRDAGIPAAGWLLSADAGDFPPDIYLLSDPADLERPDYIHIYCRCRHLPWTILETERTVLREFTASGEDLDALRALRSDPDALRFLPPLPEDRDEAMEHLKACINNMYIFSGFGMWAVVLKETGEIIGEAGFSLPENSDTPELGYCIAAPFRRRGLGLEVCRAVLSYAGSYLGMDRVTLRIDRENTGSLALANALSAVRVPQESSGPSFFAISPLR